MTDNPENRSLNDAHQNVDAAEVAKFDALASRWWDPEGEFRPLHQINPLRLDWIRQYVDLEGRKVLDGVWRRRVALGRAR